MCMTSIPARVQRALQNDLKPQHRPHHPLYGSMVSLHKIIERLRLSNANGRFVYAVVMSDGGGVAPALINSDLLGHSLVTNRLV